MSDQQADAGGGTPADQVTDFGDLYPRQQTIHTWTVLHLTADEANTAYQVNTRDRTCSCGDQVYNQSGGGVCKHLSVALFESSRSIDVGEALNYDLHKQVTDVQNAVQVIERRAAGLQADAEHDQAASDDSGGSVGTADDPVARVRAWLRSEGVPVDEGVSVYEHDRYGSVQIEKVDQIDDDEFQALRDATSESFVSYDQNNDLNYIPEDQLEEVPE